MVHIKHPGTTTGHQTYPTSHLLACLVPSSLVDYCVRCACVTLHTISLAS